MFSIAMTVTEWTFTGWHCMFDFKFIWQVPAWLGGYYLKPMTHLKVFFWKSLLKATFIHTHLRKFLLAKVNFQK